MVTNSRRANGFTLIEVLMVIAIMGVLMGIAVPSVKSLLNTQKMKSATFDLVTTAMLARSEALKWNKTPTAATDYISIRAAADDFSNGWCIVFTSDTPCTCTTATNCAAPYTPDDRVMQVIKPTAGVAYIYQGTAAPIKFTRTGRLLGTTVTLLVTDNDSFATPRCVTVDTNGNAKVRVMAAGTTSCP